LSKDESLFLANTEHPGIRLGSSNGLNRRKSILR
jgi:hypothetical protein